MRDIIARRLSKRMGAEFTNFIRSKGLMDETAEYLPRLLAWVGDKIVFWQSELGSNLAQGNPKIGVRHSLAFTSNSEKSLTIIIEGIISEMLIKMRTITKAIHLILKN